MRICPRCGSLISEGNKFCTQCGYLLDEETLDKFEVEEPAAEDELHVADERRDVPAKKLIITIAACLLVAVIAVGIVFATGRNSDANDKDKKEHSLFSNDDDSVSNNDLDNKDLPDPQPKPPTGGDSDEPEKDEHEPTPDPVVVNKAAHKSYESYTSTHVDTGQTDPEKRDGGYVSMTFRDLDQDKIDEAIAVSVDDNETKMKVELLAYDQEKETVKVADTRNIDLDSGMSQGSYDEFHSEYDVYLKDNNGDTYLCVASDQTGGDEALASTQVFKIKDGRIKSDSDCQTRQVVSTDQLKTTINNDEVTQCGTEIPENGGSFDISSIPDAEESKEGTGAEGDEVSDGSEDEEGSDAEYLEDPDEDGEMHKVEKEPDPASNFDGDVPAAVDESVEKINEEIWHAGLSVHKEAGIVRSADYDNNSSGSTMLCELDHTASVSDPSVTFMITDHTELSGK